MTVHDDGTTSNEDRLGAIGDIAFAIERGGLAGEDLLIVAGDNLIGYSLADFVAFWRGKDGSAIAVRELGDPALLTQYGVVELDEHDRVVGLEEKPAEPKSDLAATASYLYRGEHLALLPRYLDEGNPPDAPGNFMVWLHTREPSTGIEPSASGTTSATWDSCSRPTTCCASRRACRRGPNIHRASSIRSESRP